ncbi:MAG: family 78 glycoside hydrolase catalytic domain [Kiritimatiellae bacterium]|jgi:alpha-L-rhamnosidase|nr:family 78 glycoside hydrolase catalytic domain [Kiritimatiellia bacterium]
MIERAVWISSSNVGGKKVSPPAPYFRKEFQLTKEISKATLCITALGLYECEINGKKVGDHVLAPGWTVYRERITFQTHDVSDLLQTGSNAIGAVLGDGWYCGHIGNNPRENYGEFPELLCELSVEYVDGTKEIITSDETWKTNVGPILSSDLLMGETYDARRELGDWSKSGYDDSNWQQVLIGEKKDISVEQPIAPPVRRIEEINSVGETDFHGERIIDLGQNFTGRARLRFKSKPGRTITFRYAEMLQDDGALYTENLRGAKATDYYTCAVDGIVEWEPVFTFHGFRYVGINGLDKNDICEVAGIVLHNDMDVTGGFSCSHALLNQLEHNILWGQKSNFLEVPTDCPQRDERLGWTGDAQVFIRTAASHMNVQSFFHKWLQDMRDDQCPGGAIPPIIPNSASFDLENDGNSAWADATIICPWTLYLCYNDVDILKDHYGCMTAYMDYLVEKKIKDNIRCHPALGVWGGFGDWLALDGSGKTDGGTPKDLIGTAFYANNADLLSRIASILGKDEDASKYRKLHSEIVSAFQSRYITPDGLMASGTQTSYVLSLHFGLIPENAREEAANMLVRNIKDNGMHLATGFVGTPYLLDVLEKSGHIDVAYELLEQETFPSWLFPVKNGATTIWERWDGWTPDKGFQSPGMNSFNHYAYGCVGDWMIRCVAGLDLDDENPGFSNIIFKPRPGGTIKWAEAHLNTSYGEAKIHWELLDSELKVTMNVPQGAKGTFYPPEGWKGEKTILEPGENTLVLTK